MLKVYRVSESSADSVRFKSLIFPAGEPHVEVDPGDLAGAEEVVIDARLRSADEFLMLLVLTDALRRLRTLRRVRLFLPYLPGGRQDRAAPGTALTVKIYADLLNAEGYASVTVVDPHSDVTAALLQRCVILDSTPLVARFAKAAAPAALVAPDAGAEKRVTKLAVVLGLPVLRAWKVRDPMSGALSGFGIEPLRAGRGPYLVVDDLCDGGATFVGLADEITRREPRAKLFLWVTHGLFSKGTAELLKRYDTIGTTDSFVQGRSDPRIFTTALRPRFCWERRAR